MMALSRNYQLCISFAVTALLCFFSLTFLPPKSPGGINHDEVASSAGNNNEEEVIRKMVLGSRPPGCVNKCMSCRPCEATLVIPPHKINSNMKYYHHHHDDSSSDSVSASSASHREDDSYYLLSWKCRCGSKLYQP